MANARSHFDLIAGYLSRAHDCTQSPLFGKPAILHNGEPFMVFHFDGVAFRLRGRQRLQASALAGAHYWDPFNRNVPNMDWVSIPIAHFLRWDRFAIDALRQRQNQAGSHPEAGPAQGPPPAPPAAQRWSENIRLLMEKIRNLKLVPIEAQPPRQPDRLA